MLRKHSSYNFSIVSLTFIVPMYGIYYTLKCTYICMMAQNVHYSCISENDCSERHSKAKCRHFFVIFDHKNSKNGSARVQEVSHRGSNCNWNGIFAYRKSSNPIHGSYGSEDGAALPLDVGMALAHQPMDQIFIFLAQMVHFSWETPLIIPDFEIFKICGFWALPTGQQQLRGRGPL